MTTPEIFLIALQIITNETFTALLLMTVGSTILTIPMVTPKLQAMAGLITKRI